MSSESNRKNAALSTGPNTDEGKRRSSKNATKHGLFSAEPVVRGVETLEEWEEHFAGMLADLAPVGRLEEALAGRVAIQFWRLNRVIRYEREAIEASLEMIEAGMAPDGQTLRFEAFSEGTLEEAAADHQRLELVGATLQNLYDVPEDQAVDKETAVAIVEYAESTASGQSGGPPIPGVPEEIEEFDAFDNWTVGLLRTALSTYAKPAGLTGKQLRDQVVNRVGNEFLATGNDVERRSRERAVARRESILPQRDTLDKIVRYETSLERSCHRTLHELQRLQAYRRGAPVVPPIAVDVDVVTRSEDE